MKIKKFGQIFESNSITNIEVKNIIDDVLVELKDVSEGFSWHVYIAEDPRNLRNFPEGEDFKNCHLIIKYFGDDLNPSPASYAIEWVTILERAFYILNEEGISIYDQKQSNIEVKPGKMNLFWTIQSRRNPMNFAIESAWWEKDFYLKMK